MSKIYIIQYGIIDDLIIAERIKSLGKWMNYFSKTWILQSELSAHEIYNKISLDFEKELILVIELNKSNYWGVMPKEVWDYLEKAKTG
jgi:hypothetical protein